MSEEQYTVILRAVEKILSESKDDQRSKERRRFIKDLQSGKRAIYPTELSRPDMTELLEACSTK